MSIIESSPDARALFHLRFKQARERMGCGQKKPRPSTSLVLPRVQERKGPRDTIFISSIPARIRLGARIYDAPIGPMMVVENITIRKIQDAVCTFYGVRRLDMVSQRRTEKVVRPRHIAMYLAREMTVRSFPEIGRAFGGRDHTTIMHAVDKITSLIESCDAPTIEAITAARAVLCVQG